MSTLNGLPAHILLVHAVVVLLPVSALLLAASVLIGRVRRRFAGANALLSVGVLALVPLTTGAGEWLQERVGATPLVADHAELGGTALFVAVPVAVLAVLVWWRQREDDSLTTRSDDGQGSGGQGSGGQGSGGQGARAQAAGTATATAVRTQPARRTVLAPRSAAVGVVITVLSVLAAGAAVYDTYLIGDSGARASWEGSFSSGPVSER